MDHKIWLTDVSSLAHRTAVLANLHHRFRCDFLHRSAFQFRQQTAPHATGQSFPQQKLMVIGGTTFGAGPLIVSVLIVAIVVAVVARHTAGGGYRAGVQACWASDSGTGGSASASPMPACSVRMWWAKAGSDANTLKHSLHSNGLLLLFSWIRMW
uniref:Uncharacterized protein n=1 Tax=Anopheles atroparvus TaxID=41427 RepID=A0A182J0V3_ANOAO